MSLLFSRLYPYELLLNKDGQVSVVDTYTVSADTNSWTSAQQVYVLLPLEF